MVAAAANLEHFGGGALRRDAKLLIDRDDLTREEAAAKLDAQVIVLALGPDVAGSTTLQAAALTAANLASRWCGRVQVHGAAADAPNLLPNWPHDTLGAALRNVVPTLESTAVVARPDATTAVLSIGGGPVPDGSLVVTFDGWVGAAVPVGEGGHLPERERCVVAGVLAAALAVGEVFQATAGVHVEACRRVAGLSLWRPDLPFDHPDALGPVVAYLPNEAWALGLGHLGQAYLWTLSLLPFAEPGRVNLLLNDFDRVELANLNTQILTGPGDVGLRKTRVASKFLQQRGFDPTLLERRFGDGTRAGDGEPKLALCGFDGQGPRHLLDRAGFAHVVECGIGGSYQDFDAISLHTFPNAERPAWQVWNPNGGQDDATIAVNLAENRRVYQEFLDAERCGHVDLARKSVAVPFVGAAAAALVVAETLRALHDGERYASLAWRLTKPAGVEARPVPDGYRSRSTPTTAYQPVLVTGTSRA